MLRPGQTVAAQRAAGADSNAIPTLNKRQRLAIRAVADIPNAHGATAFMVPIQPSSSSSLRVNLPRPKGNNWAPRVLKIERGRQPDLKLIDTTELLSATVRQRWAVCALQAYVERGASACALYTFSITGTDLQRYYNHQPAAPPAPLRSIAEQDGLLLQPLATSRTVLWRLIQYVLVTCVGGRINIGPVQDLRSWSDVDAYRHNFPGPWQSWPATTPGPQNTMPLLALFEPRPLELGVSNAYASSDFNQGIVIGGANANAIGWRSYRHDPAAFEESATGKEGLFVPVGVHGFNCAKMVSEPFDVPAPPRPALQLTVQPIADNDNGRAIVNEPTPLPAGVLVQDLVPDMRVLRPLSCRTHDWDSGVSYAPAVSNQLYGHASLVQSLAMTPEGPRADIGVTSYSPTSRLGAPPRRERRSAAFAADEGYAGELAAKRTRLADGTVSGN